MLTMQHRLRHDQDIARTLRAKLSVFDDACGAKVTPNKQKHSRFAVVVGTKVSKSAVVRNRIRRQYREIIRLLLPRILPGYDVLLLTSKLAIDLDYHEKESRLLRVLTKAKLLRPDSAVSKNIVV